MNCEGSGGGGADFYVTPSGEKKEKLENRFWQPGKKAGSVRSVTRYQYDADIIGRNQ